MEQLETRQLMHSGGLDEHQLLALMARQAGQGDSTAQVEALDPGLAGAMAGATPVRGGGVVAPLPLEKYDPTKDPKVRDQQMGLPMLDSNPGAPVTIYLDFNGNFESDWFFIENGTETHFRNVSTPTFSMDGNAGNFNTTEQATIKEIWSRVVEDYAPFNVNISTDYYGGFNNGQALHVVIGGRESDWLKLDASGFSSIGSFTNNAPDVVYVFDLNAWANAGVTEEGRALNVAASIATTISHEAGHAFGLRHHARYGAGGVKITDYDPGTSAWTPIMGNNLASDRTTWESGPTDLGVHTSQRDMDVLAAAANHFGLKADDHGNSLGPATWLTSGPAIGPMTGKGVIGTMTDIDAFKFTTSGGTIQVQIKGAQFGSNLMPIAELWSASGLVSRVGSNGASQVTFNANVGAGTYFVLVRGYGDYGDVGQFTIAVTPQLVLSQNAKAQMTMVAVAQPTVGVSGTPITKVGTLAQNLQFAQGGAAGEKAGGSFGIAGSMIPAEQPTQKSPMQKALLTASRSAAKTAAHDAVFGLVNWALELDHDHQSDAGQLVGAAPVKARLR